MEKDIKKNLLDLKYNKYLQYYNTTIIILCTYLIGIIIAIIGKQIQLNNWRHLFPTLLFTVIFLAFNVHYMLKFKTQLSKIPRQIANTAVNP